MLFWLARLAATIGYQMLALLIGWQVYALTGSAFDLGLVGLIQFVPAVVLTLADRPRRRPLRPPLDRALGAERLRPRRADRSPSALVAGVH